MGDDNTFPITTLEKAAGNWCHVVELLGQCTEQTLGRQLWLLLLWFCRWEPRESWEAWSVWALTCRVSSSEEHGWAGEVRKLLVLAVSL